MSFATHKMGKIISKEKKAEAVRMALENRLSNCDDKLVLGLEASKLSRYAVTGAIELGIFSFLNRNPDAKASDIVERIALPLNFTEALLTVLAAQGLLIRTSKGSLKYENDSFDISDSVRRFLLPGPLYMGFRFMDDVDLIRSTLDQLRAGLYSRDFQEWSCASVSPERAAEIAYAMQQETAAHSGNIANKIDFGGLRNLLDVGGGIGGIAFAIAKRHPSLKITIMELEETCKLAEQEIIAQNLTHQIGTYSGNFFVDPWPLGHDAVFMSNILHNWNNEKCLHLLKTSYSTLPIGGRIFIHEALLKEGKDGPLWTSLYSLRMAMFAPHGRQFTFGDVECLLENCCFSQIELRPTSGYYSVITALKTS